MSLPESLESSLKSEGSGLTFVRPLPRSRTTSSAATPENGSPLPNSSVDFASQLFPVRGSDDSSTYRSVTGLELGHFVIEERIGRGGMGAVFRAIDKRLDRVVALKILSPDLSSDPEAVHRFQNEARAAARLDHDNIARVHYIGEEYGLHFIAFEFVTGTNVREFILQKGKLSPESVVNYTLQVAEALRHTAAANVVHRDIKPSNIIVSPTGRAKLVDLGLARHHSTEHSEDLTVAGTALGTFDYIAPEQAMDARNVDVRSDIYSLGCTMYHMLTGEPPYPKGTVFQKVMSHHGPTPPEARLKNPKVSAQLSRVIQKMMASNPDERYATPDALITDLVQIAESLGLSPTYPEAVVWTSPLFKTRSPYWDGSRTWMAVALVLLLLVFLVDRLQVPHANRLAQLDKITDSDSEAALPPREGTTPASDSTEPPGGSPIGRDPNAVASAAANTQTGGFSPTHSGSLPGNITGPSNDLASPDASNLTVGGSLPAEGAPASSFGSEFTAQLFTDTPSFWEELRARTATEETTTRPGTTIARTLPEPNIGESSKATPATGSGSPAVTVPSATTEPAAVPARAPFLVTLTRSGGPAEVSSLAEAFVLAADNSAIEVRTDGEITLQKESVQFANKRVILRASENSHPAIRFDLTDVLTLRPLASHAAVFEIGNGGALEIYDIDIELIVDSRTTVDEWSIVKLAPGAEFSARWSSFTVNNPLGIPAALVYIPSADPADLSSLMPERMSGRPSAVQIRESICRGQMDLIKQLDLHPLEVRLDESAVAISGTIHRLSGANAVDSSMSADAEPATNLTLSHVSGLVGEGLLRATTGEHGALEPVVIDLRDSVLRVDRSGSPLLAVVGHLDADLLIDKIQWKTQSDRSFVQVPGPLFTVESSASFLFEPQVVPQQEIGAPLEQIFGSDLFELPGTVALTSLHTVQPAVFALKNHFERGSNPAVKSASDGRNAGVDWSRLGLPKALPLPAKQRLDAESGSSDL